MINILHICVWESSVQDGCRDCSQSTKNASFVWPLRTKIWPMLTAFQKSFCVDLWRWMKHGYATILHNHVKGQNSGLNLVQLHQSVQKRNNRLGKLWLMYNTLGCTWSNLHRLPWERKDDYWSILCCIIGSFCERNQEETATFEEENPFSWWQCTISHIEHCTDKKTWIGVLSRTKELNGKQKGILEGLTNRIIWKAYKS